MNPQFTEIKNWKEMVAQVGLERAKVASKKLRDKVKEDGIDKIISTSFDLGKFCIFEYVGLMPKTVMPTALYEFTGVAM